MTKTIKVNLGPVDQIGLDLGKSFIIEGKEIAVFRGRNGKLFAVQNICPHRNVPLADGMMAGENVVCPGHGHRFDLQSGQGSEKHECLCTYPVYLENNDIILEFSRQA